MTQIRHSRDAVPPPILLPTDTSYNFEKPPFLHPFDSVCCQELVSDVSALPNRPRGPSLSTSGKIRRTRLSYEWKLLK